MAKLTLETNSTNVTILAADDYSWTWSEERGLWVHERGERTLTFEQLVAEEGPLLVAFEGVTPVDCE